MVLTPRLSAALTFLCLLAAIMLSGFAGCAPASAATPEPVRAARSFLPTKFARVIPTDTPTPTLTSTPVPSATTKPTRAPTRPNTPTTRVVRELTATNTDTARFASVPVVTPPPTSSPTLTQTPTREILGADSLSADSGSCAPFADGQYDALDVNSAPTNRPAEDHPDLNLRLRSYKPVSAFKGLVDYDGATDYDAPQLYGLFADQRTPSMTTVYQVFDWNWGSNTRADPVEYPEVTLVGLAVEPGETLYTPDFGHDIGLGHVAMVLYAGAQRLTLKYTREDNVVTGYTLHLEGICVEPRLLDLYNRLNGEGRGVLPALRPRQPLGRADGFELGVAIRDHGTFLDPRSRKDWWIGR